jgi:hypothetical protein
MPAPQDAPLMAAVAAHQADGHEGETITCQVPACQQRVSEALAAEAARLPVPPGARPGRLFPA